MLQQLSSRARTTLLRQVRQHRNAFIRTNLWMSLFCNVSQDLIFSLFLSQCTDDSSVEQLHRSNGWELLS